MSAPVRYAVPEHTRFTMCKGCTKPIAFVITESGKKMPVEADGTPHWASCPGSKTFRSRKALEERLAELRATEPPKDAA